jgi:hypothetical protein
MSEAHLRLSPNGAGVTSTLQQIGGDAGLGTCRLEIALSWAPSSWQDLGSARVIFGGEVEVSFSNGMRYPIGQLQAVYAVAFADGQQKTHPARADLRTNLLPAQLEMLEHKRAGGPLTLHLKLRGVLIPGEESTLPSVEGFWGDLEYRLKSTEWMEVLEGWNYAQGFLLQVPMFADQDSTGTVRASKELEKAIADMAEGRYREAIATCRDALEMAYGAGDKNAYPDLEYSVKDIHNAGKKERFWLARQGAWAIAHAAKHRDDTTDAIEWDRRDARALILMLSALLEQDPPL